MKDILIFAVTLMVSFPAALFIIKKVFGNSILRTIMNLTLGLVYFSSLVSYIVGHTSLIHMSWSFPSAFAVAIVIFIIINKRLKVPLVKSIDNLKRLAEGDLTIEIQSHSHKGELADLSASVKSLRDSLKSILGELKENSDLLAIRGRELSRSAEQLSQSSNDQAASVEEISSTMEEISSNIEQNAENGINAEAISTASAQKMMATMDITADSRKAINNISDIVELISDISQQTNILALNASVEAKRVGEAGKGFVVVANEVRMLADRSTTAAMEITQLVTETVGKSEESFINLEQVTPEIERSAVLVQEIAASSREQSNGAMQINNALQSLNNTTQLNASTSEELSASAIELLNSSEKIVKTLDFFKI